MLGYLSVDIICSEKRTVFREQSLRKTVSYEAGDIDGGGFDVTSLPVVGTFDHLLLVDWALPMPSWIYIGHLG